MQPNPEEQIQFIAYSEPALDVGNYKIVAEQTILGDTFSIEGEYAVYGERFSLASETIHGLFPAEGSMGMFSETIPHIALTKDTFLWERSPFIDDAGDGFPWLVLLLFDETEFKNGNVLPSQTITLEELEQDQSVKFPSLKREPGQEAKDKIKVIDVKRKLLEMVIPNEQELALLAHTRNRESQDGNISLLMANRFPKRGSNTTMHLISVEGRYTKGIHFNYDKAAPDDYIRLVSLKSWDFSCPIRYKITTKTINRLAQKAEWNSSAKLMEALRQAEVQGRVYDGAEAFTTFVETEFAPFVATEEEQKVLHSQLLAGAAYTRTFEQLVEAIDTGNLAYPVPEQAGKTAKQFLENGYMPIHHQLRQCDQTYSWYHGPLVPFYQTEQFATDTYQALPDYADNLTRFIPETGMFDVTYSAAFQVGRAAGLKDKEFAKKLYQWKYNYNLIKAQEEQQATADQLGVAQKQSKNKYELQFLNEWFADKALLNEIPFNYLVPDEQYLPEESIRFFTLDAHWIECLLYGAFTIGGPLRKNTADFKTEELAVFQQFSPPKGKRSGFLIRSQLVVGWPDLLVEGYGDFPPDHEPKAILDQALPQLCLERLSPEILLCIFEGDLKTADLYLKPEGLNFGADVQTDGSYNKEIITGGAEIEVPFKEKAKEYKRLDIVAIAKNIQAQTAAEFGMEMIDGSNKGRFIRGRPA